MKLLEGGDNMGTIAEMLERRGEERAEQRFLEEKEKLAMEYGQKGKLEAAQEMVIEFAGDRYGTLPLSLERQIRSIQSVSALKNLGRQIMKLDNIEEFAGLVHRAATE